MTIFTRLALFLAAALVFSFGAFAHGAGEHLKGAVKSIDEKTLVITTAAGEQTVALDKDTKFEKAGKAASAKELEVGARVVVHAKKTDRGSVAALVKFALTKGGHDHDHDHGEEKKPHDHDHTK